MEGETFPKAVLRAAFAFARNAPGRKDTVRVSVARRLATEQAFEAPPRKVAVTVDGKLDEWPRLPYRFTEPAGFEQEPRGWTGPQDASLRFATAHDEGQVYVALSITDDRVELTDEGDDWDPIADRPTRDGLLFWVDPHPGGEGDDDLYFMVIPVSAQEGARVLVTDGDHRVVAIAARTAARKTETGYDIEVMLPKRVLWDEREGPLEALRLNLALSDLDEHGTPPDVLYWRPQWESAMDYLGSGVISLER